MRHMAVAAGAAAGEQEHSCSGVEMTQLWRDAHPEAEANRTTHGRIHTLVNRTQALSESGPEQDSDMHEKIGSGSVISTRCRRREEQLVSPADLAQHVSEHAVHELTVRQQAVQGTP